MHFVPSWAAGLVFAAAITTMFHWHLSGDKQLTCPTAITIGTFNLAIYGGARRLIRDRYPLATEVSFWRDETPVIRKAVIGHLARYTVQETHQRGLELQKRYDPEEFQAGHQVTRHHYLHALSAVVSNDHAQVDREGP